MYKIEETVGKNSSITCVIDKDGNIPLMWSTEDINGLDTQYTIYHKGIMVEEFTALWENGLPRPEDILTKYLPN